MSKPSKKRVRPGYTKTSVTLGTETYQRLGAACVAERMTQSEVVALLIDKHLSGYHVGFTAGCEGVGPT